ncbi:hypothetical protein D3C73_1552460 [compost metagenome]
MLIHRERDFQLGAYAVGSRYQHRLLIFIFVQPEQSAETAQISHNLRTERPFDVLFHPLYRFIACRDIHTGVFVSFRHVGTHSL